MEAFSIFYIQCMVNVLPKGLVNHLNNICPVLLRNVFAGSHLLESGVEDIWVH